MMVARPMKRKPCVCDSLSAATSSQGGSASPRFISSLRREGLSLRAGQGSVLRHPSRLVRSWCKELTQ
jgi:hypothetical protein